MRPKLRSLVPRRHSSHKTHHKPQSAADHRVQHRSRRSKPGGNISPQNPIHNPIQRSQRQRPISRCLPRWRKHSHRMERQVRQQSQNQRHHNSANHRTKASSKRPHTNLLGKVSSIPVHPACHNFWRCIKTVILSGVWRGILHQNAVEELALSLPKGPRECQHSIDCPAFSAADVRTAPHPNHAAILDKRTQSAATL